MLNILACCANGVGTSVMMGMTLEKVIRRQGYQVGKRSHCSISEGKTVAEEYDIVLCPANFVPMFDAARAKGVKVIGLRNVMSESEMTQRLERCGLDLREIDEH